MVSSLWSSDHDITYDAKYDITHETYLAILDVVMSTYFKYNILPEVIMTNVKTFLKLCYLT